ncbi:hypothetical protein ZIOFF_049127 [Zingiber officinale]|uniref:Abscisic stress ripening n=1 Tax=Zingiber officinale TaxID=94328 RepID=A0A8J5FS82_ZINOF|nr:hypothetical protein ZIOFF_049127 [Zingiber officinale]
MPSPLSYSLPTQSGVHQTRTCLTGHSSLRGRHLPPRSARLNPISYDDAILYPHPKAVRARLALSEEQPAEEVYYSQQPVEEVVYSETTVIADDSASDDYEKYQKEEKQHKHKQHLGEAGAIAAGAFALYEKHEAKKDPEHAHRHKIVEEVAAAVAVGSGGFAFHEHHEKKEAKEDAEEASGKKHHHLF